MAWVNFMVAGEFNPPHIHSACDFSSVLFIKIPKNLEKENKKWMRRIIVAKNDININGEITMNDILYLRKSSKETSISASETEKIIGKRVKKTVKKLQPIYWTNLE